VNLMTYAVAVRLQRGLVFAADTRTNAGIDNVSQFRKLHFWRRTGDRVLVLLTAGNLAISQSVISIINEQLSAEAPTDRPTLMNVSSMYRAARVVGDAVREVRAIDGPSLDASKTGFSVSFIISDACIGLAESAAEFFPEAAWQRCVVHWYRNIFSHVPSTKVREIAAMLKAIHASEDIAAAREKAIRVIEKLRGLRLSRAAELVEAAVEETLAYYTFPEEHWRRIRTNNPLERILREIRRRTRVVGAFPDGQSALNLAAARLRHIAGTAWSTKRYLNIELLKDQQMRGAITA